MSTEQQPSFETQRIDHLGIAAGICHEIGLIGAINQAVGPTDRKVSCGAAAQAMVLNGLGFTSRALYLMPQYLDNKPVDLLIDPDLSPEDFNDDTLGRSLDQLFESGVTEVFARVAQQALKTYGIEHRFFHLDSSSFHLHGQYSAEEPEIETIEITYGFSKEQRPDLKQVVLSLITGHHSQLPVWMEVLSGNHSDKDSFPDTIQAFCKQLKAEVDCFFVVDSALYGAENLRSLGEIRWLTRVPETLAAAKRLVVETEADEMTELPDGYAYLEVPSDYAGVAQRWLVIHSPVAAQREEKTLLRRVEKEEKAARKAWRKLSGQTFNCTEDAEAALSEAQKKWKYHRAQAVAIPLTRYSGRGRPAAGATPDVVGYQLQGEVLPAEEELETARRSLGRFILATNEPDPVQLSPDAMLSQYKAQAVSVERGFRFLKDPLFFADSLFLKSPGRIMALIMIMVLALLVYSLAERKLRLQLAQSGEMVLDQVGKETQTPTMRWIFQVFEGIDLLIIRQNGQILTRQVLNLRPEHLKVIRLLGPPIEKCYILGF
jgi:transposase